MAPSPHIYTMNGLYIVVKKLFEPYEIVNDALAIVLGAGILGTLFLVANRFLGAFSYNGLTSDQIADVIKNLTDNYTIISSVSGRSIWGRDYKRGILSRKRGVLYYYRFEYQSLDERT